MTTQNGSADSATPDRAAQLLAQQLEWINELRPGKAKQPEDLRRFGRVGNEPPGESENGQTPADELVGRGAHLSLQIRRAVLDRKLMPLSASGTRASGINKRYHNFGRLVTDKTEKPFGAEACQIRS